MAHLLMFDEQVPVEARAALEAAQRAPRERQGPMLQAAARILFRQTDLECHEARELVDMPAEGMCG